MASRELQITSEPEYVLESGRPMRSRQPVEDVWESSFLFDLIRKRWWLVILCVGLTGLAAYFAAMQFGSTSALCRGSLLYRGLPIPPGPTVYQSPSLVTYRDIFFATPNMQRICERHDLGLLPAKLAEHFECSIKQGSSVMEFSLAWPDAKDGVALMNDSMAMLIEEAARQREHLLREHIRHVETALLAHKSSLDAAVAKLRVAQQKRDEVLREGGLSGDRYSSALERVSTAQASLDSLHATKLGFEQRIERIDKKSEELIRLLQRALIDSRLAVIKQLVKPYQDGHSRKRSLSEIHSEIKKMGEQAPPSSDDYARWKAQLLDIGRDLLPPADQINTVNTQQLEEQFRASLVQRETLELDLIPLANQISLYEKRVAEYERDAERLAGDISGISSADFNAYENNVEVSGKRLEDTKQQLDNMRQLEQARTREFVVAMPSSIETTTIDSNKKKLFVLSWGALLALVSVPIFGLEWLSQRQSPVCRFADRYGLPIVAERLLANGGDISSRDWRSNEAVRMATLRIQQCINRPGNVVLFSSLGKDFSPVRLMSSIAECLAHREERVLIVDAIDPVNGDHSLISNRTGKRRSRKDNSKTAEILRTAIATTSAKTKVPGLSDYLSRECEGVADLVQPTSCPGVDLISAGGGRFPSEAMASSCMTELFDHCRKLYSIILVAGPPVASRADFQMLAARADGILLAAHRTTVNDPVARQAVHDLVELRAPIIGVIG